MNLLHLRFDGWQKDAACKGDERFFGLEALNQGPRRRLRVQLEAICAGCPVRDECEIDLVAYESRLYNIVGFRAGKAAVDRRGNSEVRTNQRILDRGRVVLLMEEQGYSHRIIAERLGVHMRSVVRWKAERAKVLDQMAEAS